MPAEISDVFDILSEPYSGKEKWIVITAAILAYIKLTDDERQAIVEKVASTSVLKRSFAELVRTAACIPENIEAQGTGISRMTERLARFGKSDQQVANEQFFGKENLAKPVFPPIRGNQPKK